MRVKDFFGRKLFIAVAILAVMSVSGTGFCTPLKKVAVLPFTMNSPQDLGFLQNGLFTMLSSRLTDPGKVAVLDRDIVDAALAKAEKAGLSTGTMSDHKARQIGKAMGVNFVLFGSLTHFGESVSLDAKMVEVSGEKLAIPFFEQSNTMGDVIPLVDGFASEINEKIFDRQLANAPYVKRKTSEKKENTGGLERIDDAAATNETGMEDLQRGPGFSTHLKVKKVIRAMAVGDLNNNGQQQVVAALDSKLMIYHFEKNRLVPEKTLEYDTYLRIVGLDIADVNKNGFPEIFVSATTIHRDNLASFVVEYNKGGYTTLIDGESRYYGVVTGKDKTKVLLSQDRGTDPFSGSVYEMAPANGTYQKGQKIRLPRGMSVRSLARGPVSAKKTDGFLGINRHNRLTLVSDTGATEWESTKKYGKSNNYWLLPAQDADLSYRERVYFNPRVDFHLGEEDNEAKVFVVKNQEVGGGAFGRIKRFKEGRIEIMEWSGIGLTPISQTSALQGWISDFAVIDVDGDGHDELLVSVVSRTKMFILSKDTATNIISYKLNL